VFDFDETGEASFDELVLAARTVASGLAKLTLTHPPDDEAIEPIIAAVSGTHDIRTARFPPAAPTNPAPSASPRPRSSATRLRARPGLPLPTPRLRRCPARAS